MSDGETGLTLWEAATTAASLTASISLHVACRRH